MTLKHRLSKIERTIGPETCRECRGNPGPSLVVVNSGRNFTPNTCPRCGAVGEPSLVIHKLTDCEVSA